MLIVSAWNGIIAESGDIITLAKWNEMIATINTKLSSNNVYGTWGVTITASGGNDIVIGLSTAAWINTEALTVPGTSCVVSATTYNRYMNGYVVYNETIWGTPGAEAVPIGTIDPDNTSTGDAGLIDNDYTSLTYNNSDQGSANKSLPAINLGASIALQSVRLSWWTPQTYGTTNGIIQWSNDGINWTNLASGIVNNTGATGDQTDHSISWSWQYIRFFNVSWQSADWITMAEIEAFTVGTPGTPTTLYDHVMDRGVDLHNNGNFLEVCNTETTPLDIEIHSLQ